MSASALALALLGLPCIFAPDVVLQRLAGSTTAGAELMVQITGALYLGFAGLNWMGKANLMGGIYGRPVAIGNLLHFLVAAIAIFKTAQATGVRFLWPIGLGYASFALGFALIVFRNPLRTTDKPPA
jgi:hypothetical protein